MVLHSSREYLLLKRKATLAEIGFLFPDPSILFFGDYFVLRMRFHVFLYLLQSCKLHTARGAFDQRRSFGHGRNELRYDTEEIFEMEIMLDY